MDKSVFDTHARNSPLSLLISRSPSNLSLRSAPCQPPVLLPPCAGLASVQEGCSSVYQRDVRASATSASAPAGIWLLLFAPANSAVHSASGHTAAVGSCDGLDHPGSVG